MNGVYLNSVNARVTEHFRAFCERFDKFVDLLDRHLPRRNFVRPTVGRGTCGGGYFIKIHERLADGSQKFVGIQFFHHFADRERPSEARRQLNKKFRPGLMEFGHPFFQIFIHLFVLVKPLPEHGVIDRLTSRHNKTCVVLRDFHDEARAVFVEMVLFHPAEEIRSAHARQNKAVLDLAISDLPRCEEGVEFFVHIFSSAFLRTKSFFALFGNILQ